MTDPQVGILMMCMFIVIIFLGFPIAFTLIALAVFFGYYAMGDNVFQLLVQRAFGVMSNDVLIAVPLFLFMGYMVERSNILDRLFHSAAGCGRAHPRLARDRDLRDLRAVRHRDGHRRRRGDPDGAARLPGDAARGLRPAQLSAGVICAGGTLGILIPPSVMLILYGATAGVSVVRLYAAAFFPGLMLAGMYMLYVGIRARYMNPSLAPKMPDPSADVPLGAVFLGWPFVLSRCRCSFSRCSARSSSGSRRRRRRPRWARSARSCWPSPMAQLRFSSS